jgi:hypothetical protein
VTLVGYDACHEPETGTERFVELGPRLHERGGVDLVANPAAFQRGAGLCGSLVQTPFARFGVTAHLVGKVLDLTFEGTSQIVERVGSDVTVLASAKTHDRAAHVSAVVTS